MNKSIPFIDLSAQYDGIKDRVNERISEILMNGNYINGPEVSQLEEALAQYVGVNYVISCGNGTDALELALLALGIGVGDAVFCPTFTFFASAEAIARIGATPVFVDSNVDTYNICVQDLEKKILATHKEGKLRPAAIMSVDLFGLPADYYEIQKISDQYSLFIIEDAAQGFGGSINGKKSCSFGHVATTSFFPAKPLGCYGDGGAVFTNDKRVADIVASLKVHGKGRDKYNNIRIGMNSRLDTIQAAILLEKLKVFHLELVNRQKLAERYSKKLDSRLILPTVPNGFVSSWAQYTVRSENRQEYIDEYKEIGVPTMIYYNRCMHQQPAFEYLGYKVGDFPVSEKLAKEVFSLPMHGYLTDLSFLDK